MVISKRLKIGDTTMNRNQFVKIVHNFAQHANKAVRYKSYVPSACKEIEKTGILKGIGTDSDKECFIIASLGTTYAIHFNDVELTNNY